MTFGVQTFSASGALVWDSSTATGGIIADVRSIAAGTAPTYSYPAFQGRTARVMSSTIGKDLNIVIDYALGYPRVSAASVAYPRKIIVMVV